MTIAVLYTDGELKLNDIKHECKSDRWAPALFCKEKNDSKKSLICFKEISVLESFIKRNIPKKWLKGAISLSDLDVQWVKDQGWELQYLDYPKKLIGNPNIESSFEVIEFQTEPDVNLIKGDKPDFKSLLQF